MSFLFQCPRLDLHPRTNQYKEEKNKLNPQYEDKKKVTIVIMTTVATIMNERTSSLIKKFFGNNIEWMD